MVAVPDAVELVLGAGAMLFDALDQLVADRPGVAIEAVAQVLDLPEVVVARDADMADRATTTEWMAQAICSRVRFTVSISMPYWISFRFMRASIVHGASNSLPGNEPDGGDHLVVGKTEGLRQWIARHEDGLGAPDYLHHGHANNAI